MPTHDITVDEKNQEIVIRLPLSAPTPSKSGKTLVIGGTSGFQKKPVKLAGETITVSWSVNVVIPR